MSTRPVISVVIPVYNRSEIVLATLQSVAAQSFTDFECVVVDDGSLDAEALVRVVDSLADPRFRLLRKENGGGSQARNFGIRAARADWIALLDSDDLFMPDKLARDLDLLGRCDFDPKTVIFAQVELDRGLSKRWLKPNRGPFPDEPIGDYLMRRAGWVPSSTLVLGRALAIDVPFDEGLAYGDDTDLAIRLGDKGARFVMHDAPAAIVNDRVTHVRISAGGDYRAALAWTERIRPLVSAKAYAAYRGHHVAKMAKSTDPVFAARLFLKAVLSGAYGPREFLRIGLQLLLPPIAYRQLASWIIGIMGRT